jgi:hypothetical protein
MGQTLVSLADKKLEGQPIFDKRMVVEVAESFHFHYRNLRIVLSQADWESFGKGVADAWKRWLDRGKPEAKKGQHIELCRKEVASSPIDNDFCKVNLNKNLYAENEGRIFAEGAEFSDETYLHVKVRDIRLEFSKEEFKIFSDAICEARETLF